MNEMIKKMLTRHAIRRYISLLKSALTRLTNTGNWAIFNATDWFFRSLLWPSRFPNLTASEAGTVPTCGVV